MSLKQNGDVKCQQPNWRSIAKNVDKDRKDSAGPDTGMHIDIS